MIYCGQIQIVFYNIKLGNVTEWELSQRGVGYVFGEDQTKKFCQINSIELICRAHQLVKNGFE